MDMYENRDESRFPDTRLVDFCNRFCLSNRINNPTRVTKTSKSLIDVLLTSHVERHASSGSLHLGLSDHDLIFTVRKNENSRPKPRLIEFRSMKNFKLPDFLADLKRVPWSSAYTFDNADDVWAHWRALFKDVLDQHVPLKKKWIRGDQLPWISPDLLRKISHRNKLFKRHKRNPTSTSWDDYKRQRNKVTSLKCNAVKRFCCDTSLSAKHPGEFWRKMKPLLPTSSGKNIQGVILVEDSGVVSDPGRVAEVFSDYFANIIQLGHRSDTDYTDHPSIRALSNVRFSSEFNYSPVSTSYICNILDHLNPRKAVGVDGISPRILRLGSPVLAEKVTNLINFCILNRSLPSEWKQAHLTPVFKRGVDTDKANYRPVSILTSLSKVFEKVIYDQTWNAFHNVLSSNLSGFMKTHSCCTALLKMTEHWRSSIDNKEAVAAVAVDLRKAFDAIDHSLLLAKLKAYGFSTRALQLMSTYLLGRQQCVRLDGVCSDRRILSLID